jgi:lipoic acid synthetase
VTRDDLEDGGAGHFSNVVETIQAYRDDITIELLVPDFRGSREATSRVCEAGPDIFGHNIETVPRLYRSVRRGSDYRRSLLVLRWAKECSPGVLTKSAILVGLGEGRDEVRESLRDLRTAGCDIVAIGQYLRPSRDQLPVKEFVRPEEFTLYKEIAYDMGFRFVMSGPFVRSSFEAGEAYQRLKRKENFDYEGSSFAAAG